MTIGRFLAGVAALIYDPETGRYLLLRRGEHRDFGAGHWECVTGRLDQGEGFEMAIYREVREELGVAVRIEFFVGTTHFYRGEPVPENDLVGVICACSIDDPDAIRVGEEHSEHRWATTDEIQALLPPENWLVLAIERAETIRSLAPPELRTYLRERRLDIVSR